MIKILCFIIGVYWLLASVFAVWACLKMFNKYSKYEKFENNDPKWECLIRDDFDRWDKKKILIGCVLKFPGKLALFVAYIMGCLIILFIQAKIGLGRVMEKIVKSYLNLYYYLFSLFFIEVSKDFQDHKIRTPIITSNHVTFFDVYILLSAVGPLSFMAKREIQKYPLIGPCADGLFCLYVDREQSQSRKKLIEQIEKRVGDFSDGKRQAYPLVIFPEGTTSNGKGLLSFKIGAFENKSPLTMFYLDYEWHNGCSLGMDEISQLDCILLVGCTKVKVKISKIILSPEEKQTAEEYMARCRRIYAEKYKLRCSEGGFRDKVRLKQYRKDQIKKQR